MLSKLTGSFTTKQTPQIKQEIELDDPFKHFAPGELVTGAVLLEAIKPIRATHLVVRLHGLVKVVSHSKLPGEPIPYDEHLLNSAKGPKSGKRRGGEYFGNGFARLFEEELVLCGDGRLSGNYEFRFELRLPSTGMPSSIDVRTIVTQILVRANDFQVRERDHYLPSYFNPNPAYYHFSYSDQGVQAQSQGED